MPKGRIITDRELRKVQDFVNQKSIEQLASELNRSLKATYSLVSRVRNDKYYIPENKKSC